MSTRYSLFLIPDSLLTLSPSARDPRWAQLRQVVLAIAAVVDDAQRIVAYAVDPDHPDADYLFAIILLRSDLGALLAFVSSGLLPTARTPAPFPTSIDTSGSGPGGGTKPLIAQLAVGVATTANLGGT